MMINMETAITFLNSKVGKVTYSMRGSRNFSDGTCDCSGAVYTALRKAGASNLWYIASTETLHAWLISNGFTLISENNDWQMQRGDVVIWGKKGQSAGAGGHTGICVDGQNWLECTAWNDLGETIQNHDARWSMNGGPYFYVYRLNGSASVNPSTKRKDIRYALHVLGSAWLPDVVNNTDYAGKPNMQHDLLTIDVDGMYRVHTPQSGWLPWVSGSNKNDTINGCAGMVGEYIDGVQIKGYNQQVRYRSQTTERVGWLDTCYDIDNGNYAGLYGEPLDRLQVW